MHYKCNWVARGCQIISDLSVVCVLKKFHAFTDKLPLKPIDLFEEELSIAQVTGLELILMGDFNIDLIPCTNNKWSNLLQLFDLSQLVREPTRVTESSAT